MKINDHWNNYEAVNSVINGLIDQKLENYEKIFLIFFSSLRRFQCNWISNEAILEQLTSLLNALIDKKSDNY